MLEQVGEVHKILEIVRVKHYSSFGTQDALTDSFNTIFENLSAGSMEIHIFNARFNKLMNSYKEAIGKDLPRKSAKCLKCIGENTPSFVTEVKLEEADTSLESRMPGGNTRVLSKLQIRAERTAVTMAHQVKPRSSRSFM